MKKSNIKSDTVIFKDLGIFSSPFLFSSIIILLSIIVQANELPNSLDEIEFIMQSNEITYDEYILYKELYINPINISYENLTRLDNIANDLVLPPENILISNRPFNNRKYKKLLKDYPQLSEIKMFITYDKLSDKNDNRVRVSGKLVNNDIDNSGYFIMGTNYSHKNILNVDMNIKNEDSTATLINRTIKYKIDSINLNLGNIRTKHSPLIFGKYISVIPNLTRVYEALYSYKKGLNGISLRYNNFYSAELLHHNRYNREKISQLKLSMPTENLLFTTDIAYQELDSVNSSTLLLRASNRAESVGLELATILKDINSIAIRGFYRKRLDFLTLSGDVSYRSEGYFTPLMKLDSNSILSSKHRATIKLNSQRFDIIYNIKTFSDKIEDNYSLALSDSKRLYYIRASIQPYRDYKGVYFSSTKALFDNKFKLQLSTDALFEEDIWNSSRIVGTLKFTDIYKRELISKTSCKVKQNIENEFYQQFILKQRLRINTSAYFSYKFPIAGNSGSSFYGKIELAY